MRLRICALLCSALLAGCVSAPSQPPIVETKAIEAKVEVSTPCVSALPQPDMEFLSDKALLTGTGSQVADQLWADHLERRDYIDKLLAALTGCMAPSGPSKLAGSPLK
jgi:hypothetical protein